MGAEGVNKVAQKWEGIKRYEDEQAMGARLLRCVGGLVAMGARQQLGEVGICSMMGHVSHGAMLLWCGAWLTREQCVQVWGMVDRRAM